jgi:limonene-1,2-epoxide hydrolase
MTPIEIVDAFIAAIEAKDVDAAVAFASDDISYENMPTTPIVGRAGLAKALHGFLGPASEVEWRILDQWCVERTVINERLDRFRIGDGWLELPIAGVFRIDGDGRIALWRDYFDLGTYMRRFAELTGK